MAEFTNVTGDRERRVTFLALEYAWLTRSVRLLVTEQFHLERNTLFACGAIYTWLFTTPATEGNNLQHAAYWLPPAIFLFAMLRSISLLTTLQGIYAYLKSVENEFGGPAWLHFVDARRDNDWLANSFRVTLAVFWFLGFALAIFVAWHVAPPPAFGLA